MDFFDKIKEAERFDYGLKLKTDDKLTNSQMTCRTSRETQPSCA